MDNRQNITGIPSSLYTEVFSVLDQASLSTIYQLIKLGPNSRGNYLYPSSEFPWALDLAIAVKNIYSETLNFHKNITGPALIHGLMMHDLTRFSWTPGDKIFDFRSRYGCIFPGKILYISYQICLNDKRYAEIPYDFLVLAIWLRPLLENGLALLLPSRIKAYDEDGYNRTIVDCYYYRFSNKNINIDGTGYGIDDFLSLSLKESEKNSIEYNTLMSPMLFGSRIEDQVELALENYDDFKRYFNAVTRYMNRSPSGENAIREWIEEISDKCIQLEQIHKKKQKSLKNIGISSIIGLTLTAASLCIPMAPELKQFLTTVISSKTVFDGFQYIGSSRDVKKQFSHGQLWAIWKSPIYD